MRSKIKHIYNKLYSNLAHHGVDRFWIVRTVHDMFISILKKDFVEIEGNKMFLDKKDSLRISITGSYEPAETALIKTLIKQGDTVVDIGANIGYYTLLFAKLVGEKGKVFAFEPEPENYELLEKNIQVNGYNNVVLIKKAALDTSGTTKLFLSDFSKVRHSVCKTWEHEKPIEIESITLDSFFKDHKGKIDFIKMDIQGAEGKALKGMKSVLKNNKNIKILTEFWPYGLKRIGTGDEQFLKSLTQQSFSLSEIKEDRDQKPTTIQELLKRFSRKDNSHTNILCTRRQ